MNIASLLSGPITGLIGAVGGIIDNLHTSDEEKAAARERLEQIATTYRERLLGHAEAIASYQRDAIVTEAASRHWLAANWRPILMLVFTGIIAWNYAGVPILSAFFDHLHPAEIPPDMWDLLKLGVGGYIVGRSAEKVLPQVWGKT